MNILVIRHAATLANAEHRINGQHDEALSDAGKAQLPAIVNTLHGEKIDVIYSSPLKRALGTALPIAKDHNTEIVVDERIIEIAAGTLTGMPYESTVKLFGMTLPELLNRYKYDFNAYGGENSEEVRARVKEFLQELQQTQYKDILIVTHGGILRWISYLCSGQKIVGQPNGSVLRFTLEASKALPD